MEAINQTFGGNQSDNHFVLKEGNNKLQFSSISIIDEFDLVAAQVNYHKDLIIERVPDNRPDYYHFNLINQGQIKQSYQNSLKYTHTPIRSVLIKEQFVKHVVNFSTYCGMIGHWFIVNKKAI